MFTTIFKKKYFNRRIIFATLFLFIFGQFVFANTPDPSGIKSRDLWTQIQVYGKDMVGTIALWIVSLLAKLFSLVALLFDNLLAIGLSTDLFKTKFVAEAWTGIRDFANVAFILGFLYVAFRVMLNLDSTWEKTFVKIVVAALIMNFSLFLSLAIVDTGNITARLFYNSIGSPYDYSADKNSNAMFSDHFLMANAFYNNNKQDAKEFRSIAGYFQSFVQPENLYGVNSFKAWRGTGNGDIISFLAMNLLVGIYFVMLSKTLFQGGFMFLSRIVWLIYYVIISPLALISMFMPKAESFWKNWLSDITSKSFCIAIYLFLLWLAGLIMQSGLVSSIQANQSDFWMMIAVFAIKGIIVYNVLQMATEKGTKFCGDSGQFMKFATGIAGVGMKMAAPALSAVGGAPLKLGGLAAGAAARQTVGRLGMNLYRAREGKLYDMSKKGGLTGFGARQLRLGGKKLAETKFMGASLDEKETKANKQRQQLRDMYSEDDKKVYDQAIAGPAKITNLNETKDNYHGFVDEKSLKDFMTDAGLNDDAQKKILEDKDGNIKLKDTLKNAGNSNEEIDKILEKYTDKTIMSSPGGIGGLIKQLTGRKAYTEKRTEIKESTAVANKKKDNYTQKSSELAVQKGREMANIDQATSAAVSLNDIGEVNRIVSDLGKNASQEDKDVLENELRNMITQEQQHTRIFHNMEDSLEMLENAKKTADPEKIKNIENELLTVFKSNNSSVQKNIIEKAGVDYNQFMNMSSKEQAKIIKKSYQKSQQEAHKSKIAVQQVTNRISNDSKNKIKGKYKALDADLKREIEKTKDDLNTGIAAIRTDKSTEKLSSEEASRT